MLFLQYVNMNLTVRVNVRRLGQIAHSRMRSLVAKSGNITYITHAAMIKGKK